MTEKDVKIVFGLASTNNTDLIDLVIGNFAAISKRHPGEFHLQANDVILLSQALLNTQTLPEIQQNYNQLCLQKSKAKNPQR